MPFTTFRSTIEPAENSSLPKRKETFTFSKGEESFQRNLRGVAIASEEVTAGLDALPAIVLYFFACAVGALVRKS